MAALLASRFARAGQIFSEKPTGARSAQHAAGNLDNRHVEIVGAASAHVNVSVLYQFVDSATQPWRTSVAPRRGFLSRSAARGPVAPRKMACRPAAGMVNFAVQGHQLAHRGGAAWSLPLSNRKRDMDAKTRDLALLAFLSVFCAGVAWILDHLILGSVFFGLGVAALGIAWEGR